MSKALPIRIGVIGAGKNTCVRHLPGLQAIEGVEIISVCNRSKESSQRVAKDFGISKIYNSWEELVASDDTDAIVIGTWPYLHCAITVAAITAGKHVMCEARMAMNLAEARTMLEISTQNPNCVAQIVPAPFSLGVDKTIQRLLAEGFVGEMLVIDIRDQSGAFLDYDTTLAWRSNYDLSGMNIMSLGIWYEILMRWVGEAKCVTSMGKTWVKERRESSNGAMKEVHIPEHLDVLAEMENGAQARFLISNVMGGAGATEAWICGSRGTLRFIDGKLFGFQKENRAWIDLVGLPGESNDWRVEEEFIRAIQGKETIQLTDFKTGVRYMAFTESVNRSLKEGCTIDIE